MTDWFGLTRRIARSVQTTVGWIFWDPGAIRRYAELGLPDGFAGPLGYLAARAAPLAGAGPEAVVAAFGSISPIGIAATFDLVTNLRPLRTLVTYAGADNGGTPFGAFLRVG